MHVFIISDGVIDYNNHCICVHTTTFHTTTTGNVDCEMLLVFYSFIAFI